MGKKATPPFKPPKASIASRLWTPVAVGVVGAAVLGSYPQAVCDVFHLPSLLVEQVPLLAELLGKVPDRLYAALVGLGLGFGVVKGVNWICWRALKSLFSYTGWVTNPRSMKTKIWGILVKLCEGRPPFHTTQFQKLLPKQPLPELNNTLDTYLAVSKNLVTEDEFQLTQKAAEEFRRNEGPKIQEYLKKRAQKSPSWISDYWLAAAYLAQRNPLPVYSNYYVSNQVVRHRCKDPVARAATIIRMILEYEQLVSSENLQPVMFQQMIPLCMSGYRFTCNTTRIPGEHMDTIATYPGRRHIIIIRNGCYYEVDVDQPDGSGGKSLLTAEEIKQLLLAISQDADKRQNQPPVAALTSQDRSTWAKNRQILSSRSPNKEILEKIESAMFVYTLDPHVPKDANDLCKLLLTGNGNDRWYDKSFTSVAFGDGACGNNVEHSVIDAMVYTTLSEYMLVHESYENGDVVRNPKTPPRRIQKLKRLEWDLAGMEGMVEEAFKHFNKLKSNLDLYLLNAKYGKGFMKQKKLSPDGYFQMIMQLAFYRKYKYFPKTYEPSTGRLFLLGRTETVHPGSEHSVAWVKAMDNPNARKEQTVQLLRRAIKHQTQFRLQATTGQGCDRHMLGLYLGSRELGMDVPNLFRDKAWQMPFKLSTSQTPTNIYDYNVDLDWNMCTGGFGPGCDDGYGISYVIMGDRVANFIITSWKSCDSTDSTVFAGYIDKAMEDMKQLLS